MADDLSEDVCDNWEDMIENGVLDKKLEELKVKNADRNRQETQVMPQQVTLEETSRTQYVISVPQVKILKRPSDARTGQVQNVERSPSKQPLKTLQQREAEYAQARLRILGAAKNEEEEQENRLTIATLDGRSPESSAVIRQPKGPDGTRGFAEKR